MCIKEIIFNSTEMVYYQEFYALMWAMQRFNSYLLGRNFVARVDHKPLVNLVTNKMSLIMLGWIDNILLYDFITEYLPGEKNNLADALSRSYEGLDEGLDEGSPQREICQSWC